MVSTPDASRNLQRSVRNFENSPIKSFCSAGRKVLAEYHRFAKTIKTRAKCTLATSRDRRDWARLQSLMAKAERDLKAQKKAQEKAYAQSQKEKQEHEAFLAEKRAKQKAKEQARRDKR